jgi:hypothetical protein
MSCSRKRHVRKAKKCGSARYGPVDIVFHPADNLQKYHYQVSSIWVF